MKFCKKIAALLGAFTIKRAAACLSLVVAIQLRVKRHGASVLMRPMHHHYFKIKIVAS